MWLYEHNPWLALDKHMLLCRQEERVRTTIADQVLEIENRLRLTTMPCDRPHAVQDAILVAINQGSLLLFQMGHVKAAAEICQAASASYIERWFETGDASWLCAAIQPRINGIRIAMQTQDDTAGRQDLSSLAAAVRGDSAFRIGNAMIDGPTLRDAAATVESALPRICLNVFVKETIGSLLAASLLGELEEFIDHVENDCAFASPDFQLTLAEAQAWLHWRRGQPSLALAAISRFKSLWKRPLPWMYVMMCSIYRNEGHLAEAKGVLKTLHCYRDQMVEAGYTSQQLRRMNWLMANEALHLGDIEAAGELHSEALRVCSGLGDEPGELRCLLSLRKLAYARGESPNENHSLRLATLLNSTEYVLDRALGTMLMGDLSSGSGKSAHYEASWSDASSSNISAGDDVKKMLSRRGYQPTVAKTRPSSRSAVALLEMLGTVLAQERVS